MRRLMNQRGIAMVTVLLVGATLTVVGSAASFVTIREFRQGTADRKAAEALSYAEAGIDRFLLELRRGVTLNYNRVYKAGCEHDIAATPAPWLQQSGSIGNGTYDATFSVVDCSTRPVDAAGNPDPSGTLLARITSTGEHPTAKRVIEQDVEITALGLPIGVFAESVDANGNGGMLNISLVSSGDFHGREKVGFDGFDPYYTQDAFYGNDDTSAIPAAAHVAGRLTFVAGGGQVEHPPSPNCDASNRDAQGQSLWDGDNWTSDEIEAEVTGGCDGQTGFPPTSRFTSDDLIDVVPQPDLDEDDYAALAEAARSSGIYCQMPATSPATNPCTIDGVPDQPLSDPVQDGDIAGLSNQFIAYFDFTTGDPFVNTIKWNANVWACNDDPALHRSAIIIVRNGGVSMQSATKVTGAIIASDGQVDSQGSFQLEGTVIAKKFWYRGGASISLSECWVTNMPGPFLTTNLTRWTEIDR